MMSQRKARPAQRPMRRSDTWLAVLAGAGVLLAGYLLIARAAHAPVYCPVGSGCEVVQSSRYAELFGVPVAALGLGFYGILLALALAPLDIAARWRLALPIVFAGVAASAVFTVVQQVLAGATCSLCLASAVLTLGLLLLVVLRPPQRHSRGTWTWAGLAGALTVLVLVAGYAISTPKAAAQDYAEGLAKHLSATGAKFYGAFWCPHCADQKALFGKAASLLPYVECDRRSPIGQPTLCVDRQIRAFPTWEIAGQRIEGVLSLADLAQLSGYPQLP